MFERELDEGEKIEIEFKPEYNKKILTNDIKNTIFILIIYLILTIFIFCLLDSSLNIIKFLFILMFLLLIYTIIYNINIKPNKLKNTYYCLTNKKIIVYNLKKNKYKYMYLSNIENIFIDNYNSSSVISRIDKNEIADICLYNSNNFSFQKNIFEHQDDENLNYLQLESLKNPKYIENKILELKNKF